MANKEVTVKTYVEKLEKLVHNSDNPRKINDKRYRELIQSLTDFPEMKQLREIVVDEKFLILAGDKRVWALKEMGYTEVLIKQVTGLTEKKKREFIAKDNDHYGDWDSDIIANSWDKQDFKDWGIKSFKFPGDDDKKDKDSSGGDYKNHGVTCPNCGHHFDLSESDDEE